MKQKPTFSEKEFSMPAWLYQMTAGEINGETWYPEDYRKEVWEGEKITWPVGEKIYIREQDPMSMGIPSSFSSVKVEMWTLERELLTPEYMDGGVSLILATTPPVLAKRKKMKSSS